MLLKRSQLEVTQGLPRCWWWWALQYNPPQPAAEQSTDTNTALRWVIYSVLIAEDWNLVILMVPSNLNHHKESPRKFEIKCFLWLKGNWEKMQWNQIMILVKNPVFLTVSHIQHGHSMATQEQQEHPSSITFGVQTSMYTFSAAASVLPAVTASRDIHSGKE